MFNPSPIKRQGEKNAAVTKVKTTKYNIEEIE